MLFQFKMPALLGGQPHRGEGKGGEREREREREREGGEEKGRGKTLGMEHLLVIPFHIPYGFITIMRQRRLQSV